MAEQAICFPETLLRGRPRGVRRGPPAAELRLQTLS